MPSWLSFWLCSMKHNDKPLTKVYLPTLAITRSYNVGPVLTSTVLCCTLSEIFVFHSVSLLWSVWRQIVELWQARLLYFVFFFSKSPNSETSSVKVGNFLPPKLNFPCGFTLAAETNKFYAWHKRLILALTRRRKVDPGSTLPNQCG